MNRKDRIGRFFRIGNPRGGAPASRLLLVAISCSLLSPLCLGGESAGGKEAAEVRRILSELPQVPADELWIHAGRIVQLGRATASDPVIEAIKEGLKHESERVRLVAARALCQLHEADAGAAGLVSLVKDARDADVRRFAANAIGLSAALYNNQGIMDALGDALEKEKDPKVRISIGRSLWRISSGRKGTEVLMELLESADKETGDEAALVLAENGFINHPKVRERLLMLYSEPTAQGERAFNLLRHAEEPGRDRPPDPKIRRGERLLREIVSTIMAAYPDDPEKKKSDPDRLFEEAAKGLVGSLDPYSQYLDREEVKATREMLSQDYGGIGAYVGMRDNVFTIISPIYGSPADKAGLRALDRILEVDGVKTSEIQPPFTGVIKRLKGPPGTPVKIKYWRRGFSKPVTTTLIRAQIRVESVHWEIFPGEIGYIRLTRFGEHSVEEIRGALAELRARGMKGLVFDVRDNPGGLLRGAVEVADCFLGGKKLIVYSEGRPEFAPRKDFYSSGDEADEESYPMVVLLNAGSASASEIVAGALRDHKRARLVGEKSYGKGSVQQIIPLAATDRETELRLTIAKYYLPSGQCIDQKGIEPDIKWEPRETAAWKVDEINGWAEKGVLDDYVRKMAGTHRDTMLKLAQSDGGNPAAYPEFDALYESLKTRMDKEDVRAALRVAVRRWAQDEMKKMFACDLQEDEVLQRGLLEVLRKLGLDPAAFDAYRDYPKRFAEQRKSDIEKVMAEDEKESRDRAAR